MENPFELLDQRISVIEDKLDRLIQRIEDPESVMPVWMTTRQLAEYLSVSANMITKLRTNKIPYYRFGGKIMFKKQEIDLWIKKTRHMPGNEHLSEYLKTQ